MAPGKMIYRYSKGVYVAPAGEDAMLVVPGETFQAVEAVLGEAAYDVGYWWGQFGLVPEVVVESSAVFWRRPNVLDWARNLPV
jgi:hypothetical protein